MAKPLGHELVGLGAVMPSVTVERVSVVPRGVTGKALLVWVRHWRVPSAAEAAEPPSKALSAVSGAPQENLRLGRDTVSKDFGAVGPGPGEPDGNDNRTAARGP